MSPFDHKVEAERLLDTAEADEFALQTRRRQPDVGAYAYDAETGRLERELDVLLRLAAVHATLATVPR